MNELDDAMNVLEGWENKEQRQNADSSATAPASNKILVGNVDQYFSKIGVIAIKLTDELAVGDIVEVGNEEEAIRQRISSIQINGENVETATAGDDVGIKLKYQVSVGDSVYKIK